MHWFLLAGAIALEVTATTFLKLSDGFTKVGPTAIVVGGYVAAFVLLSQVLARGMQIGVAYGVWAAAGIALIAVVGTIFLDEQMTWIQVVGIALVMAGVLALELGAKH